jgi:hypothetical protein
MLQCTCLNCRCILQGLKALHVAGYGHSSLQWCNVIELPWLSDDNEKNMLIDLEHVVKFGTSFEAPFDFPSWQDGTVLNDGTVYTAQSDLK